MKKQIRTNTKTKIMIAIGTMAVTAGTVTPIIVLKSKTRGDAKTPPNMRILKHFARSANMDDFTESDITMFRSQIERSYQSHVETLGNDYDYDGLTNELDMAVSSSNDNGEEASTQTKINNLRSVASDLHINLMDWFQLNRDREEYLDQITETLDDSMTTTQKETFRNNLSLAINSGIQNNQTYDEFQNNYLSITVNMQSKLAEFNRNNQKLQNLLSPSTSTDVVYDNDVQVNDLLKNSVAQDKILSYQELSEFELPEIVKDSYLNTLKPMFGGMKTAVPEYNTITKNQGVSGIDNVFLRVGDKLSQVANYGDTWLSSMFFGWKDGSKTDLAPKSSAQFDAQKSKNQKMLDIKKLTNTTTDDDFVDGLVKAIDYDFENDPFNVNVTIEWSLKAEETISDDDLSIATFEKTYTFKLPKVMRMWLLAKEINDSIDILSQFLSFRPDDNVLWQDFLEGLYANGNKGVDMTMDSLDNIPVYSANDDIIGTDIPFEQLTSMSNLGELFDKISYKNLNVHMTVVGYSGNNGSNVLYVDFGFIDTDNDDYILPGKNELWAANRELEDHDDVSYNENISEKLTATEILKKLDINSSFDNKKPQINLKATPKEKYALITDFYEGIYTTLYTPATILSSIDDHNKKYTDAYNLIVAEKIVEVVNSGIQIAAIGVSIGYEIAVLAASVGTNVTGGINLAALGLIEYFSLAALGEQIVSLATARTSYSDLIASNVSSNLILANGFSDDDGKSTQNDIEKGYSEYKNLDYHNSSDMSRIQELYLEIWHALYDEHDSVQLRMNKFMNEHSDDFDADKWEPTVWMNVCSIMTYISQGVHILAAATYIMFWNSFKSMVSGVSCLSQFAFEWENLSAGGLIRWNEVAKSKFFSNLPTDSSLLQQIGAQHWFSRVSANGGGNNMDLTGEKWISMFEEGIKSIENTPVNGWRKVMPNGSIDFIVANTNNTYTAAQADALWANGYVFSSGGLSKSEYEMFRKIKYSAEETISDMKYYASGMIDRGGLGDRFGGNLSSAAQENLSKVNIRNIHAMDEDIIPQRAPAAVITGPSMIIEAAVTLIALSIQMADMFVTDGWLNPAIQNILKHYV